MANKKTDKRIAIYLMNKQGRTQGMRQGEFWAAYEKLPIKDILRFNFVTKAASKLSDDG